MKTLKEMREMYEAGTLQILTISEATIGRTINTIYFGYHGQDGVDSFTIGEIISEYDLAAREEIDGYPNRAAYWESYMTPAQLDDKKHTMEILTNDGHNTYIRCNADKGVFWSSDVDRTVFFTTESDEN